MCGFVDVYETITVANYGVERGSLKLLKRLSVARCDD